MPINEASKTTLFLRYAKHCINHSFAFEAKIAKGNSIPFNALKDHQINNLHLAKHGTWNFKIPDTGFQNPFDGVQLKMSPAYVVIFWHTKKGDKRFTLIDIDMFCDEKFKSPKKSLTYERSCEIGKCLSLA